MSFGVELKGKCVECWVVKPFTGIVIKVYITQPSDAAVKTVRQHGIAVVLRSYVNPTALEIFNGLITAAVSITQFFCFCACCKSQQLMTEANSENRDFTKQLLNFFNAFGVFRGISCAV